LKVDNQLQVKIIRKHTQKWQLVAGAIQEVQYVTKEYEGIYEKWEQCLTA
jgi:hypothetical protein